MTRNELNVYLAAILTTLAETGGAIESTLYIGVGMDIGKWTEIRVILVSAGLVEIESHYVTLTAKGRDIADKCNAALAAAR